MDAAADHGRDADTAAAPDAVPSAGERHVRVLAGIAAALGGLIGFVWLVVGPGWWLFARPLVHHAAWVGDAVALAMGVGGAGMLAGAFRVWRGLQGRGMEVAQGLRWQARAGAVAGMPGVLLLGCVVRHSEWLEDGALAPVTTGTQLAIAITAAAPAIAALALTFGIWLFRARLALVGDATRTPAGRRRRVVGGALAALAAGALATAVVWPGGWTIAGSTRTPRGRAVGEVLRSDNLHIRFRADELGAVAPAAADAIWNRLAAEEGARGHAADALDAVIGRVGWTTREFADEVRVGTWGKSELCQALVDCAPADPRTLQLVREPLRSHHRWATALGWARVIIARGAGGPLVPDLLDLVDRLGASPRFERRYRVSVLVLLAHRATPVSAFPATALPQLDALAADPDREVRVWAAIVSHRISGAPDRLDALVASIAREISLAAGEPRGGLLASVESLADADGSALATLVLGLQWTGVGGARMLNLHAATWNGASPPDEVVAALVELLGSDADPVACDQAVRALHRCPTCMSAVWSRLRARLDVEGATSGDSIVRRALRAMGWPVTGE